MEEENEKDFLNAARRGNVAQNQAGGQAGGQRLHPLLTRRFELFIVRGPNCKQDVTPLRQLKSDKIGHFVLVKGIVVRVTEMQPKIQVACYTCKQCGFENYQEVPGKEFTPLAECQSQVCVTNKLKGKLSFSTQTSQFTKFQEVTIQETSDQVPQGNVPRSFTLYCEGVNVRCCSPGDMVTINGVYLPSPRDNWRSGNNLVLDTYLMCYSIARDKKKYIEMEISDHRVEELLERQGQTPFADFYQKLAVSISPEIFGLEDVKKALLLLMVGGITNAQQDGMKIRGDINIALVGDPGIAKSQLLKQVASLTPRGIYTTGKGSSGVGLTASVVKDPNTGEVSLEGGALVLADMGVCCIDEFDKMGEHDRTSIHEVMEQQTVSIAKAGITTQLNARTSILAAANPVYGRYNKKLSPTQNINLPAALLTRFDLVFILQDKPNYENDKRLSRHIGFVHRNQRAEHSQEDYFDRQYVKDYVAMCKKGIEQVTLDAKVHELISQYYIEMRKEQSVVEREKQNYITPRSLLGIIRLAQAHARLRLSRVVQEVDIQEAIRLIEAAQSSVNEDDDDQDRYSKGDTQGKILEIIKRTCKYDLQFQVKRSELEKAVFGKGYTTTQLDQTIRTYVNLGLLMVNEDASIITYMNN